MSEHLNDHSNYDFEEMEYWWTINDVVTLIHKYSYTSIIKDIDKVLQSSMTDVSESELTKGVS